MKVSLRWLQEFIDLPTTDVDELSYAFDMLGLTTEGVERHEVGWSDVYVGEVLDIAAHPDADKVRVCQVDSGQGPTQIICGAWNFESGATVAVARPGAVLPGDFVIGQRTIRGVESNGMICSERELGLGDDQAGILVLDGNPEIGTAFADLVDLPDVVFELDVPTSRPDALSLVGVARDLAAWFEVEYQVPPVDMPTVPGATTISVEIADPTGCRRFTAREIRGVTVGQAPLKMRHRLHKVGTRSVSDVVDVTNYVMYELGHPLHAFDADSIVGDRLVVKRAEQGEKLETLDHVNRALSPGDLIIYDEAGPTSMSGTMGGARSEVSGTTTRVLMEAASWDPPTIMHMWRRHDLRSEAATRFERGVDPNLADIANMRASAMVQAISGGEILEGAVDEVAIAVEPWTVELPAGESGRLLGPGFEPPYVTSILERLGMTVEGDGPLMVTVPTFRPDLTRPADLVEEVARIHGFDKFDATLPTGPAGGLSETQRRQRTLTRTLTGAGLTQAINLPFVSVAELNGLSLETDGSDLLTIKNPLRDEESKLRPTLLPGLLNDLRYNRSHGNTSVGLFELGKVFFSDPDPDDSRLPHEYDRLAWAVVGDVGARGLDGAPFQADAAFSLGLWRLIAETLDLDARVSQSTRPGFHPGRTAEVIVGDDVVGHVGELAPSTARFFEIDARVAVAEVDLEPLLREVPDRLSVTPSVFPHVDFDLSFLVPAATPAAELLAATTGAATGLVESARVFDEFRSESVGKDQKALAITYRLRAADRTLEQTEIGLIRQSMIDAATAIGATLRGAE
ncbi:MAG TPA: phenylalanine--tRNA ligase subunit beta [Acidimicrobiia bacterium]|nr:phenylalanine--tRNA ligase subunit beta [Acidimicrobiia bacterium]